MIAQDTFYDNTPFEYGYSSKEEIITNMNPLLKKVIEEEVKTRQKKPETLNTVSLKPLKTEITDGRNPMVFL